MEDLATSTEVVTQDRGFRRTRSVRADRLIIEDLVAMVRVEPSPENVMRVSLRGPEAAVESVEVAVENRTLRIGPSAPRASDAHADSDAPTDEPLEIVVEVPTGSAVRLRGMAGTAAIGDIDGPLVVHAQGRSSVRAGRAAQTRVIAEGDASVDIGRVDGPRLDIDSVGFARVRVHNGHVEHLDVHADGQANVEFGGDATEGELTAAGGAHINVLRVRRALRRTCTGSGETRVAHLPAVRAAIDREQAAAQVLEHLEDLDAR